MLIWGCALAPERRRIGVSMRPIFISYRRDDTEGQAGRLFQDLRDAFGAEAVFMDVATIEPGVDFRRAIEKQTAMCGALLALIGRNWLSATGSDGRPRLEDPHDFVRLETAAALRRDIPVIPVLVHDAQMVRAEDLPDELKELAFRNGVELTHARWDSDVQLLIKALRPLVKGRANAPAPPAPAAAAATSTAAPPPRPPRKRLAFVAAGLLLGAALIGGGLVVNDRLASERRKGRRGAGGGEFGIGPAGRGRAGRGHQGCRGQGSGGPARRRAGRRGARCRPTRRGRAPRRPGTGARGGHLHQRLRLARSARGRQGLRRAAGARAQRR